ncbi:hypothetical protein LCGC14_0987350 [marine sediment metagenome]|uniref:Uncharacterized protein n=1 Tax=marine sediment metagenome TaxID=412755 RepID=A0A0F9RDI6_9ZZZZ
MSEIDKLRDVAKVAGVDVDALLGELNATLLEDSRKMLGELVDQIAGQVEGKLSQFQDNQQGEIERRVQVALEPVMKMAEEAKAQREAQSQAAQAARPDTSGPGNNSQAGGAPAWLGEGLGLLKILIEQGDPVKQLNKVAELRNAFSAFESPGPSPDTVFRIYADAAKIAARGAGKGDSSRPLERGGRSGSGGQPRGNPPKPLLDAVIEVG